MQHVSCNPSERARARALNMPWRAAMAYPFAGLPRSSPDLKLGPAAEMQPRSRGVAREGGLQNYATGQGHMGRRSGHECGGGRAGSRSGKNVRPQNWHGTKADPARKRGISHGGACARKPRLPRDGNAARHCAVEQFRRSGAVGAGGCQGGGGWGGAGRNAHRLLQATVCCRRKVAQCGQW